MPNLSLFNSETVEGVSPGHSFQDLSHNVDMDMTFGKLYNTLVLECIPGDIIELGNQTEIKFQPLHTPAFARIYVDNHYFFSPLRHLDENWEDFYTYAIDRTTQLPTFQGHLETYDLSPTSKQLTNRPDLREESSPLTTAERFNLHSMWDYFGLPVFSGTGTTLDGAKQDASDRMNAYFRELVNEDLAPLIYPLKAYMHIWDEYYRDEDLYDPVWDYRRCQPKAGFAYPAQPLTRAWMKDYFTSARPWRQKGKAPHVPVSTVSARLSVIVMEGNRVGELFYNGSAGLPGQVSATNGSFNNQPVLAYMPSHTVTSGFDISDLRMAVQLQKYFELNARAGNRYTEYLRAQFASFPSDSRLNRPELIGSCRQEVTISEVLQTSATEADSPQANRAATANTFNRSFIDRYHVEEPGYIMCITSVMIEPAYQYKIDRMWTRRSNFDFYVPLFANLSEQAVLNHELACYSNPAGVFGYQGRWNEYRTVDNRIAGALRSYQVLNNSNGPVSAFVGADQQSLDFWHCARNFGSQPVLNSDFIECKPRTDMFAVNPEVEYPMICHLHHHIGAVRPMPRFNNPGRLDHMS